MPTISGMHFLVLRPKAAAGQLLRVLAESGIKVTHVPMFELERWSTNLLKAMLDTLDEANKIVFASPSAVQFFFEHLEEKGLELPSKAQCFAPGVSTAAALESRNGTEVHRPKDVGDATSIVSMPEFSGIEGQRIDIVGGESGNHQIIFELLRRGANASYVSCYRTKPCSPDREEILGAHGTQAFSAIVIHSSTALEGLLRTLGDRHDALNSVPVLTHHHAIAIRAKREGFEHVHMAKTGKGEALIEIASQLQ